MKYQGLCLSPSISESLSPKGWVMGGSCKPTNQQLLVGCTNGLPVNQGQQPMYQLGGSDGTARRDTIKFPT